MSASTSNVIFSQPNDNPSKCSAWLKDRKRCCERVIAKADRDERDSLQLSFTTSGVHSEEQAQKFVDLHFCKNWHRRGGKHAFIRNPDDSQQLFQKMFPGSDFEERGNPADGAPISHRSSPRNGGGFSAFTTSFTNQASATSQATPSRMGPGIGEGSISPMTDTPYPWPEMQQHPAPPTTPADLPQTGGARHWEERGAASSRVSPQAATTPFTGRLRRSTRIQAQQQPPLEIPRSSALGTSAAAFSAPTPRREVHSNTHGLSQTAGASVPTVANNGQNIRRSVRIQEQTPATASTEEEDHTRTTENKDHSHGQYSHPTTQRFGQASRHSLTPRQAALASRSTNSAQSAQSPLLSSSLSDDGNTGDIELDESCAICLRELGSRNTVKRCTVCLNDLHKSCLARWLCQPGSSQACTYCRAPISEEQALALFGSIGGTEGRAYRIRYGMRN